MSRHDPLVTLKQLLDFVVEARALIEGRERSDLGNSLVFTRAAERLVTLIGEAAARLPSELRTAEAHVPWIDIIGTRNRIMHGYDVIDYDIVWGVLSRELPPFETNLRDIIARLEQRR